jgi:hypothetical protein
LPSPFVSKAENALASPLVSAPVETDDVDVEELALEPNADSISDRLMAPSPAEP